VGVHVRVRARLRVCMSGCYFERLKGPEMCVHVCVCVWVVEWVDGWVGGLVGGCSRIRI